LSNWKPIESRIKKWEGAAMEMETRSMGQAIVSKD